MQTLMRTGLAVAALAVGAAPGWAQLQPPGGVQPAQGNTFSPSVVAYGSAAPPSFLQQLYNLLPSWPASLTVNWNSPPTPAPQQAGAGAMTGRYNGINPGDVYGLTPPMQGTQVGKFRPVR